MLEKLLKQLGQELSMGEAITTTENHHFQLPFENGIELEAIELEKGGYLLKGIIGDCPQQNGEAFLLKVMEANLFGIGTRGAVIGLKENGKQLTLSIELDYNPSYKDFKEKLEDFMSVLEFWRNESQNHQ